MRRPSGIGQEHRGFSRGAFVTIAAAPPISLIPVAERHISAVLLEAAADVGSIADTDRRAFLDAALDLRRHADTLLRASEES